MSTEFKKLAKEFGENVKKERIAQNVTQEELANMANIERSYMGGIERGEKNPTLKKLFNISKALKIAVKDLFR